MKAARRSVLTAVVITAIAMVAPPAHAGTGEPAVPRVAAFYLAPRVLDVGLTEYGLARGGLREGNPLLQSRTVRFTVATGIAAALTAYDARLQRRGRSTKTLRVVYAVGSAAIIGWNVHKLRSGGVR